MPDDSDGPSNAALEEFCREVYLKWRTAYRERMTDDRDYDLIGEDQEAFLLAYLGCMMLNAETQAGRDRIVRFFELQTGCQGVARYEVDFLGSVYAESRVFINEKRDVDIADVFGVTDFDMVSIDRCDGAAFGNGEAEALVAAIRNDLEFDGYSAQIKTEVWENHLGLECTIL